MTSELLLRYSLSSTWGVKAGYLFSQKYQDKYSGKEYQARRYEYLAEGTGQRLDIGRLGISYIPRPVTNLWSRGLRLLSAHFELRSLMKETVDLGNSIAEIGFSFAY